MKGKNIIINGEESHFVITPNGKVYSNKKKRTYPFRLHTGGYLQITLTHNKKSYDFFGHRLVAINFIPNPENKPCVNHKNGIKTDNRIENLEWVTDSENQKHSYSIGLNSRNGVNNGKAKLTEEDVRNIRMSFVSTVGLAKHYGMAENSIRAIRKFRSWSHIV